MQFGKNLKYFRKRAGLTQKQLAQKLGMTYRAYQYYESGDKFPNLEKGVIERSVPSEQAELLRWIEENVGDVFFYEFDKSPENAKKQFMKDMKYMWERDKERGKDK